VILCDNTVEHFPNYPLDLPGTAICLLCYTPALPASQQTREPMVAAIAKLLGWGGHR